MKQIVVNNSSVFLVATENFAEFAFCGYSLQKLFKKIMLFIQWNLSKQTFYGFNPFKGKFKQLFCFLIWRRSGSLWHIHFVVRINLKSTFCG